MDFDKPKVYGDTSITDGLVFIFMLMLPLNQLTITNIEVVRDGINLDN